MKPYPKCDFLIVGAGFSGSVCARELAEAGYKVFVIDKRPHVGGNAYDEYDAHGILIHTYGPHIFHTNAKRIFEWLSRFTEWRFYEHRVLASVEGKLLPIPINRITLSQLYEISLDESSAAAWLERVREPRDFLLTSEDVVLNSVGKDLCEKFFRGYTKKQWGLDLSQLSAGVAARIPTRVNDDDRYFTDVYQYIPRDGYAAMFQRILNHPNVSIALDTDYFSLRDLVDTEHTIYTGPIDAFFGYKFGRLPYRSLRFEHEHFSNKSYYQSVGTVNYPNDHEYTRISEFKHITGQMAEGTSIVKEYPINDGDPYYPIPTQDNEEIFKKYKALSVNLKNVSFVGRLAEYRYYNMDQVVGAALSTVKRILGRDDY
jgi:UDP-galactopyranose mutase